MSRDGKTKPWRHIAHDPVIRELLELIEPKMDKVVTSKAGVPYSWISDVRHARIRNPSFYNVKAVGQALGYKLVWQKEPPQ